ncbi:MAG: helix-turn-helix domain-containing protein [Prolixibacteraceae bacterium]|jgi:AraC-like DNA-binding protein|nr:helix-turn-helix domain-containing protein [Prolixibacteraceae bacterium]
MEQIVLIASFLVPFVLSAVIIYNARGNRPKMILGFSMLNAAAVFVANYFYFIRDFQVYTYMHSVHVALVLFIYPSIYLYLANLTGKLKVTGKILLHLTPGMLFFLLYMFLFDLRFTYAERADFLNTYREELFAKESFRLVEWIRLINVAAIALQVVLYSTAIFVESRRYNLRIKNEFSNAEHLQIKWLSWFNMSLIIVAVVSVLFYVVNPFSEENNILLIISMFVMSVFIWLIGIWGNAQRAIEFSPDETPPSDTGKNEDALYNKLLSVLLNEKLYLKPDLTLTELARASGTNRTYASQAINKAYHSNFSTFVNNYRVKAAGKILKENPELKLEAVAGQSGFGSLLSLQRNFSRHTGTSPGKIKSMYSNQKKRQQK